jgi:hypothetical protein
MNRDPLYWTMRQDNDAFLQRQRWWWLHYLNSTLVSQRQRHAHELAAEGEQIAAGLIRSLGYEAHQTTHKCPFDLWVNDAAGRAARVEVKTSLFDERQRRYQFDIRHDQTDVVICLAKNGRYWPYVIPIAGIDRRNIAIWSYCPGDYKGRWSIYLEAWQHLDQAITNSQPRCWQLALLM